MLEMACKTKVSSLLSGAMQAQDYMFVLKIYEKVCAAGEEDIEAAPVFIEHEGSMILIQDCRRPNWVSCYSQHFTQSGRSCNLLMLSAQRFPPRGVGQPRGHLLTPVIQGTAEVRCLQLPRHALDS